MTFLRIFIFPKPENPWLLDDETQLTGVEAELRSLKTKVRWLHSQHRAHKKWSISAQHASCVHRSQRARIIERDQARIALLEDWRNALRATLGIVS